MVKQTNTQKQTEHDLDNEGPSLQKKKKQENKSVIVVKYLAIKILLCRNDSSLYFSHNWSTFFSWCFHLI